MASEDTKDTVTVGEYLEQQKSLEEEAGEVLPWNFDRCTYSKGHLRQAVYACKTCKPSTGSGPGGVCYSCSIACHADHDLIELFNKRNFQCDCGTARFGGSACQLEPKPQDALNEKNLYNHNFEGRFCWCKGEYDPEREEANMHQCVLCEDWFHENCINGEKQGEKNFSLPDLDNFEEYICRTCTSKHSFLKPYKNSHMFFSGQTVRKNEGTKEKDNDKKSKNDQLQVETSASTNKRKLDDEQEIDLKATALLKKTKGDDVCKLERWEPVKNNIDVDLFCIQNWRDELCRCSKCTYLYKSHQIEFILQEEETYEPPHDDDAHTSLFDSGMKLLAQMDRVTAIEGAIAYAKLRDDLVEFLKPFGDSGKTVTEQDIRAFFESKWSERKTSDTNSFF
ncbi:E3 ubiquitin-protein ligase UBR7 [Gigaspora margarita]|uniref:E3 ubiquitin-protein ligase UBR7 n=2 Tax=Gigaspora margarita TaxID=4874 RepID=A0A8H4AL45_GIGMA|nr:E3 ubiquitin-protein ligase UBR7 [Gigaspora margarita]